MVTVSLVNTVQKNIVVVVKRKFIALNKWRILLLDRYLNLFTYFFTINVLKKFQIKVRMMIFFFRSFLLHFRTFLYNLLIKKKKLN